MRRFLLSFLCQLAALSIVFATDDGLNVIQKSNRDLTTRMFSEVSKQKQDKNIVISAFSALTPLVQLALATEGDSHSELLDIIGIHDAGDAREAVYSLAEDLKSMQGINTNCASKMYVAIDHQLNESFANFSCEVLRSEIQNVDFADSKTVDQINSWVENKTNNQIYNLVDSQYLGPHTSVLLVNAIYFKGEWKMPFVKNDTSKEDFYVNKKNAVKVHMMHQNALYNYTNDPKLKSEIIELSYRGDQASMIIALPHKNGIRHLVKKLKDPNALDRALSNAEENMIELSLPKFKIETIINLKDILQQMKVERVFTPGLAELNNLVEKDDDLYISEALQKVCVAVEEDESETAGADEFSGSTANQSPDAVQFKANRPFYFEIRANGLTLLSGVKTH